MKDKSVSPCGSSISIESFNLKSDEEGGVEILIKIKDEKSLDFYILFFGLVDSFLVKSTNILGFDIIDVSSKGLGKINYEAFSFEHDDFHINCKKFSYLKMQ